MNWNDPHLLVRAASVYLAVVTTGVVYAWRRPTGRELAGAMLASAWNLPGVLALIVAAMRAGWWTFDANGGLLLGIPVDLYLAWVWLWGGLLALACLRLPLWPALLAAFLADLALMPAAAPVVQLGPGWLWGEVVGLLACLVPAQLLARWTARDERLRERASLQVVAFAGLMLIVLPAIVIEGSGSAWRNPMVLPGWQLSLALQALAIPALLGLTAVQEFAIRGKGTPVPFDPPTRLVTTGIYAYVGSPMQLSAVLLFFSLGLLLWNAWVAAAGVMAHIYSAGLAGWDEEEDLQKRFGSDWVIYRKGVRRWVPKWRPWFLPDSPPARLFVAESCEMCSEVGRWFERRGTRHLVVIPAEMHTSGVLNRITYEAGDGTFAASGVGAVGRALEHIHLGWAILGWWMRLPVIRPVLQLLVDASGGEARIPARRAECQTAKR